MQITKDKVAFLHYELKNSEGEILDSTMGKQPIGYIHGIGNLIPGLEAKLEGKSTGDHVSAVIPPEEAYGEVNPDHKHVVSSAGFQAEGDEQLEVGIKMEVDTNHGPQIATVSAIDGDSVTLDFNHPLAGMTLYFEVDIMGVREAEPVELDHGHVHGPGGVHH